MIIAGVLMLISAIGPWHSWGYRGWGVEGGGVAYGIRAGVGLMGLITLYSSAVELGFVDILEEAVPNKSVSAICGVVTFVGSLSALGSPWSGAWGLYLGIVAGLVSLFAAFRAFEGELGLGRGKQKSVEEGEETLLTCPECGNEISVETEFCPNCGTEIGEEITEEKISRCPECDTEVSEEASFCPECGAELE